MDSYIEEYFEKLKKGLSSLDYESVQEITSVLSKAREAGGEVFLFGNGGSAATAAHFANDLNKLAASNGRKGLKAISLTDNTPLMTAWSNDYSYHDIFSSQMENFLSDQDVAIGISGSGNSMNVIEALEYANQEGATTIALLGFDGGEAKEIADHCVHFEDDHYGRVEDAHMILAHLIAYYLRDHELEEG